MTTAAQWQVFADRKQEVRLAMGVARVVDAIDYVTTRLAALPSTALGTVTAGRLIMELQRTEFGTTFREITPENLGMASRPWQNIPAPAGDSKDSTTGRDQA